MRGKIEVGQYEKVELALITPSQFVSELNSFISYSESSGETNYYYYNYNGLNPYDPADISLECKFTNTSTNNEYTVIGFYAEDFQYIDESGNATEDETMAVDWQKIDNEYKWRIRFAPPELGNYNVREPYFLYKPIWTSYKYIFE